MPLEYSGGYRTFATPTVFQGDASSAIELLEYPVDKAYFFVGDPDGSTFEIWRFNAASSASAGASVVVPLNPLYADAGRWIKMTISGGGGGADFLSGNGDPNGSVTGTVVGQTYVDLDDNALWVFTGTPNTNTGWV
jgi:hypothetical protein